MKPATRKARYKNHANQKPKYTKYTNEKQNVQSMQNEKAKHKKAPVNQQAQL